MLAVPLVVLALIPAGAAAAPSIKKSIWGPVDDFAAYQDLGVGIYQYTLAWSAIASNRPSHPRDPSDPAYRWPTDLDTALAMARSRAFGCPFF